MQPRLSIIQGSFAADIKDNERTMRIPEVPWYQRFEPLLSCCVPNLQTIRFIADGHLLCQEIDSHCRLHLTLGTFAVSSNLSFTYRSMMHDLPTDWHPSNTIFNFNLPETVLIELFICAYYKEEGYAIYDRDVGFK